MLKANFLKVTINIFNLSGNNFYSLDFLFFLSYLFRFNTSSIFDYFIDWFFTLKIFL